MKKIFAVSILCLNVAAATAATPWWEQPTVCKLDPTDCYATESGTNINKDFDTNILNGDCFGVRKTIDNGAMASVNGEYVRVWCNGILDNPDEYLPNGEITYGAQPTCNELAEYGYVATIDNKCYGKYYDMSKYYIECNGNDILPSRIIITNNADYTMASNAPDDESAADKLFDKMQSVSESQREIYFTQD